MNSNCPLSKCQISATSFFRVQLSSALDTCVVNVWNSNQFVQNVGYTTSLRSRIANWRSQTQRIASDKMFSRCFRPGWRIRIFRTRKYQSFGRSLWTSRSRCLSKINWISEMLACYNNELLHIDLIDSRIEIESLARSSAGQLPVQHGHVQYGREETQTQRRSEKHGNVQPFSADISGRHQNWIVSQISDWHICWGNTFTPLLNGQLWILLNSVRHR